MSAAQRIEWRRPTPREAVACMVLLAIAAWLLAPHAIRLLHSPFGLGFGLALAGFLLRGSLRDAALLSLPLVLADHLDEGLGPVVMAATAAAVFIVTRRPTFAIATGALLVSLVVIASRLKQRFAGTVLTWHDVKFFFLQFRDNVGVLASQPTLLAYSAAALAMLGALAWLCWRVDRETVRVAPRSGQALAILVALVVAGWSASLVRAELAVMARKDVWGMMGRLGEYGRPVAGFLATVGREAVWTPPPADTRAFGERVRRRMAAAAPAAAPADIVVVLQESQFNPATIEGCPPALCQLDAFRPTAGTRAHGPLQVHVFGAGTWLSEFAIAGGVPHTVFGAAGSFAPFNVAPGMRRSFVRSLRDAGYRTVAVYPVRGGMMNARLAYASYGFDRFLDSADLGLTGEYLTTTDEAIHAAARRVLEQERRHGAPVFLMVVTLFNHGEHGLHTQMERVPPALLEQASAHFTDKKVASNVADYVWRTREFARAAATTRAAVLEAGRPAVLAWFGDHQPPFGNAMELRDRIRSVPTPEGTVPVRMQTWYEVSANVAHLPPDRSLHGLDIVFLPGLLAQAAGVRFDDWIAANVTAREECDGLLLACRRAGTREAYLGFLQNDLGAFRLD